MEDSFSRLPHEILVHILCLLPKKKEAAKTSVLSKRWRYLWTRITYLNFDASEVVKKIGITRRRNNDDVVMVGRVKYINWVNKLCSSIRAPTVQEFRICFDLGEESKDDLDKWVRFAIDKRVRNLELILDIIPFRSKRYILSAGCVSSGTINPYLKSLDLKYVNISGELLENLLVHCPSMESISVQDSPHLTSLKVGVQLWNLKFIKIFDCFNLKHVEVCAPNLSHFEYEGQPISINIDKAHPSLTHLYIGGKFLDLLAWAFLQLSSYLCQIRTLVLHLQLGVTGRIPRVLKLSSLKELTVRLCGGEDDALLYLPSYLKATPFLEKFRFENAIGTRGTLVQEFKLCPHEYLKVLEIVGFVGRPNEVNFVRSLCRATIRLEKLVIDPMIPWKASGRKHDRVLLARRFAERLRSQIPERVEFLVL